MAQNWNGGCCQLGLASLLAMGGAIATLGDCVLAQTSPPTIISDTTLGSENSKITRIGSVYHIDGGATRDTNLFHSFEQFSVLNGNSAHFNNALTIHNIITRVTGGSISNIDGLIQTNSTVNLFLINPNGIIFGPNARLNIGGSFVGSTASSINFANGTQFSATAPQAMPLLKVNVPLGLQFGRTTGSIRVQGASLEVHSGKTLALVGGDVTLWGGELAASKKPTLAASGGRIELGSVAGVGEVSLNHTGDSWVLGYDHVNAFGNIQLERGAFVDVSGERGGSLQIQGAHLKMIEDSRIFADTQGTGTGGEVFVHTTNTITLSDDSWITADVLREGTGTGGNVTIETGQLSIRDNSFVGSGTFGRGQGGNLAVTASDSVELVGRQSGLFTQTQGDGAAGNLTITTRQLRVQDGALVSASAIGSSSTGKAGDLTVHASEIELIGTTADGQFSSGLFTQTQGAGDAGNLTITTRQLRAQDGALVSTSTARKSAGNGGNLVVTASDSVELMGTSPNQAFVSGLFTQTGGVGSAGDLTITAGQVIVQNGAQVSSTTFGAGQGGNLQVNASESIELAGKSTDNQIFSGLFTQANGAGSAGALTVATGQLTVRDGAVVSVSSQGTGAAGDLTVSAGSIELDNHSRIQATTRAGDQGNITLRSGDLVLRRESLITTNATGTATGGDITIDTGILAALENSDITADAQNARGGRVIINAQGIFGTEFRERENRATSDITATSELGPEFSGTVEINTPDVDPSQELATLPAELVEVPGLIATGCAAVGENKFIVTGRGGLPPNPSETLSSDIVWSDLRYRTQFTDLPISEEATQPINSTPEQLVEAQGWVINNKGEVVLTATAPTVTPHSPGLTSTGTCHVN